MNLPIEWVTGPLGFPASKGWTYWTPEGVSGKWLAWYTPSGLVGDWDEIIGELDSLEKAQTACNEHAAWVR